MAVVRTTASGGVKAAHLNGQMDPAADFVQCWRKVFGRGQCVGKIVAVKIRQPPALGRIPVLADAGRRSAQFQRTVPAAWPALLLINQLFALGPDKVVNADKPRSGVSCDAPMR